MEELQLELTTFCNSNCIMCPRNKLKRGSGSMSYDFAIKVINEVYDLGARMIKLEWFGETLLVDYWHKVARYAKKKGMKVILITNGSLLNGKNRKNVLNYVDKIFISIDSVNKKKYEKIRKGLSFNTVMNNIKSLYEERNNDLKIYISAVNVNNNIQEMNELSEVLHDYSDVIIINEDVNKKQWDGKKRKIICKHNVEGRMIVGWDGKCYLCCHDWLGEFIIGDLKKQSMKEIEERKKNFIKNLEELKICQKCML